MQGFLMSKLLSRTIIRMVSPKIFPKFNSIPACTVTANHEIQWFNTPTRHSSSGKTADQASEGGKLAKNPGASLARSNFHGESEASLNKQINTELSAHYLYLAMATYFDRAEVALPGFASYFYRKSGEEREHAILCTRYMNKRGGRVKLEAIKVPVKLEWKSGLEAMEEALELEKDVNEIIIEMHAVAGKHGDPQMTNFIENTFFDEQTADIKQIANYVGTLRKVGGGLGEFEFDFEILRQQGELPVFNASAEKKRIATDGAV